MHDRHLFGHRLGVLRRMNAMTQIAMAQRLGLHQSQVSAIERGRQLLTPEVADAASREFGEPLSFFAVPPVTVPLGAPAFRRKASTSATKQAAAIESYQEASRVFAEVSERSGYHPLDLASVPAGLAIEAALALRRMQGLGDRQPVANIVRTIERMGIGVVTELSERAEGEERHEVSGLTMPSMHNARPVVATLSILRGDVQRLTLAHELGHIVFDRSAATIACKRNSPEEVRAFEFASEFLLPSVVIQSRISETSTLRDYMTLKSEYGISIKAIIFRARALGIISEQRHRTLSIQHSSRGWIAEEPVDVPVERPLLLDQALARVYPAQTFARASHDMGVAPSRLRRWAGSTDDERELAPVANLHERLRRA